VPTDTLRLFYDRRTGEIRAGPMVIPSMHRKDLPAVNTASVEPVPAVPSLPPARRARSASREVWPVARARLSLSAATRPQAA
jgi:hypothetical protein